MEPHALGLRALHAAFKEGRLTVPDYVQALNDRIAARESDIQAFEWFEPMVSLNLLTTHETDFLTLSQPQRTRGNLK